MHRSIILATVLTLAASGANGQALARKADPGVDPALPFQEMLKSPLVGTGAPVVQARVSKKDDVMVAAPVRYRTSGVLKNEVGLVDLFAGSKLQPGTRLFGVAMASVYGDPLVVWCAPENTVGASVRNLFANGNCLVRHPRFGGYAFLKATRPPLLVIKAGVPPFPNANPAPVIELTEEPALDGLELVYKLYGWNK